MHEDNNDMSISRSSFERINRQEEQNGQSISGSMIEMKSELNRPTPILDINHRHGFILFGRKTPACFWFWLFINILNRHIEWQLSGFKWQ